jgi:hypothetical protein
MKKYNEFHDGSFEGFWIDNTIVHVFLSTFEKVRFTAIAEGVVALGANGFRAGNIIFDVAVRDHEEIALPDIAQLYDLREGSAGEDQGVRLLEKVRQEGLNLLEIGSSYGGTCMVLAHSVGLMERSEWLARYLISAK